MTTQTEVGQGAQAKDESGIAVLYNRLQRSMAATEELAAELERKLGPEQGGLFFKVFLDHHMPLKLQVQAQRAEIPAAQSPAADNECEEVCTNPRAPGSRLCLKHISDRAYRGGVIR